MSASYTRAGKKKLCDAVKIACSELLPDPSLSTEEMKALQRRVRGQARFHGDVTVSDNTVVAGVDQGFQDDTAVSAVVVVHDGDVIERSSAERPTKMAYVPGLLSFREGEVVVDALQGLDVSPDVLLFDGSGRIHYREAGIATHIGVVFDTPSVGVAKSLLCGTVDLSERLPEGSRRPVRPGRRVRSDADTLGYAFQSRQFDGSVSVNPLFVSPGHRVGAEQAVEVVSSYCTGYKLPEPVRLADKRVDELTS